jgi:hypothetical protein
MHKYATPVTDRLMRAYFSQYQSHTYTVINESFTMSRVELEEAAEIGRSYVRRGGDDRGSALDRRRRKQWILDAYGDGAHVACRHCWCVLTFDTLTVDRIVAGRDGGRYVRGNIQASCAHCANVQGGRIKGT